MGEPLGNRRQRNPKTENQDITKRIPENVKTKGWTAPIDLSYEDLDSSKDKMSHKPTRADLGEAEPDTDY